MAFQIGSKLGYMNDFLSMPSERFMRPLIRTSLFNSEGFRFETQEDAFNFARESAQHGWRLAREWGFSCSEHYMKDRSEICVVLNVPPHPRNLDFIPTVVPFSGSHHESIIPATDFDEQRLCEIKGESTMSACHGNHPLMFCGAGHLREFVKEVVPSKVWLELEREVDEPLVNILTMPLHLIFKAAEGSRERKIQTFRVWPPEPNSGVSETLIQCMTQIGNDVMCSEPQFIGDVLLETHLNNFLSGLSLYVLDDVPRAFFDPYVTAGLEPCDVFFRPVE